MIIIEAAEHGMCFGVRDALAALAHAPAPDTVTIHGELVHNNEVLRDLERRGFRHTSERKRTLPATPNVMVTAHGISQRERARLLTAGKSLIDTTCPLVQRAHDAAKKLQRQGRRVIVIGKPGHVEVRGIIEDLDRPLVVRNAADVRHWPEARLGVVSQTTARSVVVTETLAAIRRCNPDACVRHIDTVCAPTKARQQALLELLPRIDGLVVIGGVDSNNTRQLALTARQHGVPALHVQGPGQLTRAWLEGRRVVGLTAGTSTPDHTIDAVRRALRAFARQQAPAPL